MTARMRTVGVRQRRSRCKASTHTQAHMHANSVPRSHQQLPLAVVGDPGSSPRNYARLQHLVLSLAGLADKTLARFLEFPQGPSSIPATTVMAVKCFLVTAHNFDVVTVVYAACESPVDFLGAAVTPRLSELAEGASILLCLPEGFRIF